jgi:hypothetical protein
MKCYCFYVDFQKELSKKQEDIFISFFQRAIEEATKKTKKMCEVAKKIPGVKGRYGDLLETLRNYMNIQSNFMQLNKLTETRYVFCMPSMKREIVSLKSHGLSVPDIRVNVIKKELIEHVFPEMKAKGHVVVKEEEMELGKDFYEKP